MAVNKCKIKWYIDKAIRRIGLIILLCGVFDIERFHSHRILWCAIGFTVTAISMFIPHHNRENDETE
jgi:hypothetical protein